MRGIILPRLKIMFNNLQAEETDMTIAETNNNKTSHNSLFR